MYQGLGVDGIAEALPRGGMVFHEKNPHLGGIRKVLRLSRRLSLRRACPSGRWELGVGVHECDLGLVIRRPGPKVIGGTAGIPHPQPVRKNRQSNPEIDIRPPGHQPGEAV